MGDPTIPEGFPDLFVYALRDLLETTMSTDPDFAAVAFLTRPARPTDLSRTISVVEGDAEPIEYEIGLREPSMYRWNVVIQAFVKHSDEVEGRNTRKRLMQRARKTLFLPTSASALMTLHDGNEHVSKYRIRRLDFSGAEARDSNKQFFFLGLIELNFETEIR